MPEKSIDRPMVTVVTVSYNSGKYIRDTIESILAQDYGDFEYIIADDASTDDTWEIISSFTDSRINAYRNPVNLGEYANRNKAIDLARGKYLIFIDGDDVLLTHGLGYFVQSAEKFPEAAMVIQKGYENNMLFPALLFPDLLIANHYFGEEDFLSSSFASNMFNLDILKREGMLSTAYKGGDNHIRVKLAAKYPVLFIAGWVSWPRETPGSASSRISSTLNIVEKFRYTAELFGQNAPFEDSFKRKIGQVFSYRVARYIVRFWYKWPLREMRQLYKVSQLNLFRALVMLYPKPSYQDPFDQYTPEQPYKADYLR